MTYVGISKIHSKTPIIIKPSFYVVSKVAITACLCRKSGSDILYLQLIHLFTKAFIWIMVDSLAWLVGSRFMVIFDGEKEQRKVKNQWLKVNHRIT